MITARQKRLIRDTRRSGLSYEEIAEITGLPPDTVKSFCRRASVRLPDDSEVGYGLCKCCGKMVRSKDGRKRKMFCGDKCRSQWWNHNRGWAQRRDAFRLTCHYCGAGFDSYGDRNRKYCSHECYVSSHYGDEEGSILTQSQGGFI